MSDKLMTVSDTAEWLSVSTSTVWRMIEDGRLPSVRIGKSVRLEPETIMRALRRRTSRVDDLSVEPRCPFCNGVMPDVHTP